MRYGKGYVQAGFRCPKALVHRAPSKQAYAKACMRAFRKAKGQGQPMAMTPQRARKEGSEAKRLCVEALRTREL